MEWSLLKTWQWTNPININNLECPTITISRWTKLPKARLPPDLFTSKICQQFHMLILLRKTSGDSTTMASSGSHTVTMASKATFLRIPSRMELITNSLKLTLWSYQKASPKKPLARTLLITTQMHQHNLERTRTKIPARKFLKRTLLSNKGRMISNMKKLPSKNQRSILALNRKETTS